MTMPAIDPAYDQLLHEIQPKVIHTKKEHARLLAEVERLMLKGEDNLTGAESAMLEMLFDLVYEYERKTFPPRKKSTPTEMLEFMMEQHNKKAADLPLPSPRVSEILSGKRTVSKSQAIALGEFFHVSPAVFLGL